MFDTKLCTNLLDWLNNRLECFFGIDGHVALDRKPRSG